MNLSYGRRLFQELELPTESRKLLAAAKYHKTSVVLALLEECMARKLEDPHEALALAVLGPRLARVVDPTGRQPWLQMRAHTTVGACARSAGELSRAEEAYQEALVLTELVSPLEVADVHCRLAALRREQRRFDEAHALIADGIQLYRAHGDLVDRLLYGRLLLARGLLHLEEGTLGSAILDFSTSVEHIDPKESSTHYEVALHNLAVALASAPGNANDLADAIAHLRRARRAFSYRPQPFIRSKLHWLEGLITYRLGSTRRGEALLEKARAGLVKLELPHEVIGVSLDLAQLYLRRRRHRAVRYLAEETYELCKGMHLTPDALACLNLWIEAAREDGLEAEMLRSLKERVAEQIG